jgi:hypothetical protein
VDAPFVDNKGRDRVPRGADTLDDGNPLAIAWLNEIWPPTSLCACDDLHRANYAHLEASLIKVVHILVMDAVLGFCLLHKLEPRANYLRIFLLYPLTVLRSIESHFKLI